MIPWGFILSRLTGGLDAALGFFAEHRAARYALYGALLFGSGLYVGWTAGGDEPRTEAVSQADTTYVPYTIREVDTVETTVPNRVTIYERDTVVQYRDTSVTIPVTLAGGFRMARPEPIRIDGREVTYTAYNPRSGRWSQSTYVVPPDRWSLGVGVAGLGGPVIGLGPSLSVRYRDWRLTGGYLTTTAGPVYLGGVHYVF